MSTKITLDHPEAHEKLTARLLWKRPSDGGYIDAGNVKEYADATTRSLVTRVSAHDGFRTVNDEQADIDHMAWTFLLDERDADNEKLLRLARQLTDATQSFAEGNTATVSSATPGRWHTVGSYNIENVSVTGDLGGAMSEGTDYVLDKENGRIQPVVGGGIADGEVLSILFDRPEMTLQQFTAQDAALFYGDFIIEEYNQFSKVFLRRSTFRGTMNVTEFPNQTGEFGTFRVKVTPSATVTTIKRTEGQTLDAITATTEPAGYSSSSQSLSSSSS